MSNQSIVPALRGIVGDAHVVDAPAELALYGYDGTAGLRRSPAAVVFPSDTAQVAAVVRACAAAGRPVVTRGSGTGLSGGSVPTSDAVVLCTLRLVAPPAIDAGNLCADVLPGVITQDLDRAAAPFGLFYPPDPGSGKISTLGGNVAENSGGLRGLKYGVTRDYVMGLEVVLPDGEIAWLGNRCVKDVAGYSLRDLFVGSEGTLGVITRILLKLVPRPAARRTLTATFPSMEAAAATVSAIVARRIVPCTLEFLDRTTLRCVEDFARIGLPVEAAAFLLIEADGHPVVVAEEADAMAAVARDHGGTVRVARDEAEATALAAARRNAFSALARVRPTTILEDVTVPRTELPAMVRAVEETALRHDLRIATFGHFGDGNLHPTFLTDERDAAEMARVEVAMGEIFDAALRLGGTITGEHGVGLAKKPYLRRQFRGADYRLLAAVKRAIDPRNLLNPGKILDPEDAP